MKKTQSAYQIDKPFSSMMQERCKQQPQYPSTMNMQGALDGLGNQQFLQLINKFSNQLPMGVPSSGFQLPMGLTASNLIGNDNMMGVGLGPGSRTPAQRGSSFSLPKHN